MDLLESSNSELSVKIKLYKLRNFSRVLNDIIMYDKCDYSRNTLEDIYYELFEARIILSEPKNIALSVSLKEIEDRIESISKNVNYPESKYLDIPLVQKIVENRDFFSKELRDNWNDYSTSKRYMELSRECVYYMSKDDLLKLCIYF